MRSRKPIVVTLAASAAALLALGASAQSDSGPDEAMSFFITSAGSGNGGDLGGLEGADQICTDLAMQAGATGKTWRAFLSTSGEGGVDARDRIGSGPWYNYNGAEVGTSVDDLFRPGSPINKATALDETGAFVNGRGDDPNRHDIITGSDAQGRAMGDSNCSNWTSSADGIARVGHFDRTGGGPAPTSWVSAHDSRSCSQPDLQATGGDGLFYCFAVD